MDEELYELDEQTQAIIEAIGEAIATEESEPQIINAHRVLQMNRAYHAVTAIAWPSWTISCELHSPFTSMGVISIEATEFTFENMNYLQTVLSSASNIEIYPLTNGKLRMNIAFHGITKRLT